MSIMLRIAGVSPVGSKAWDRQGTLDRFSPWLVSVSWESLAYAASRAVLPATVGARMHAGSLLKAYFKNLLLRHPCSKQRQPLQQPQLRQPEDLVDSKCCRCPWPDRAKLHWLPRLT
mmetsp:Transcript_82920/g.146527  ORF Transcript_82920/g.146527 Transcript_82920/m.146527 type:complete len:117 (-) Transcript_82920:119-469(-)